MKHHTMRWAALLVCALLFAACGSNTSQQAPATATSGPVAPPSLPSAGKVSATLFAIGGSMDPGYIFGIAADDTAVWVHNIAQGTVLRVDPKTNQVVATIPVGHGRGDVALEGGFVWVLNHDDSTISKIDPQTNTVVDTIALPPPAGFLAVSPGAIWVSAKASGVVRKIDPQTDQVVASFSSSNGPTWMAFAAGSLWVCNRDGTASGVTRLDPTTTKVQANIDIGSGKGYSCDGIAASGDEVWAELLDGDQTYDVGLARIDPATNKVVATILLQQSNVTSALAADAQGVWSAKPDMGLVRIDPTTNHAAGFLGMSGACGVAVGAGAVWVLNSEGTLLRITPAS